SGVQDGGRAQQGGLPGRPAAVPSGGRGRLAAGGGVGGAYKPRSSRRPSLTKEAGDDMGIPAVQSYRIARYIIEQKLKGNKRYPLVLMLEPLFQCNLACAGCGKIDYPDDILRKRMSVEDALRAVDDCGAPVVSIPGGEPLIHKQLPQIVEGIIARKKFVYLCT